MCGIAGVFSAAPGNTEELSRRVMWMIGLLTHRGPDDHGLWTDPVGRLVLGHCRLAIIDVTQEGHQPMISKCGRYVISLNGEIYNFLELKSELEGLGAKFRGHSDTEVLLAGISEWGIRRTLDKLIGMFAFALWDELEQCLFLVRDRIGKKPLYYLETSKALYFASEIKALRSLKRDNLQLDTASLHHYLTCGYVPSPHTIYKEILEIPPAHYAMFDSNMKFVCRRYWSLEWQPKSTESEREISDQVEELLKNSVKMRLRSDVPIGCFLSGGIDSGLTVAFASRCSPKRLVTLTVSVEDDTVDESQFAETVAERYETEHHVINICQDIATDLPKIVAAYDEPFADPSAIPSYLISREARKYVKVIINGDGGDEILGGYRRHQAIYLLTKSSLALNAIPKKFLAYIIQKLPVPTEFRSTYAFIHRFLRGLNGDPFNRYIAWCMDGFDEEEKSSLWIKESAPILEPTSLLLASRFINLQELGQVDHFMALDLLLNLSDCLLVKMDIATMAHGLEARSPFLDHRLAEYASTLLPQIKLNGFRTKPILRKIAKKYLPNDVAKAPKRGFEIPLIKWLREDLSDMVYDVCLSSNNIILNLFSRKYVEDLLSGRLILDPGRWANRVWILFMLGLWDHVNENRSDIK
jgi:asparagine synthase (glutamine-hydrolysing)